MTLTPDEQALQAALQAARDAVDDAWQRADYHQWKSGSANNAYARAKAHLRRLRWQRFIASVRRRLPFLSLLAFSLVMSTLAVLAMYQTAH